MKSARLMFCVAAIVSALSGCGPSRNCVDDCEANAQKKNPTGDAQAIADACENECFKKMGGPEDTASASQAIAPVTSCTLPSPATVTPTTIIFRGSGSSAVKLDLYFPPSGVTPLGSWAIGWHEGGFTSTGTTRNTCSSPPCNTVTTCQMAASLGVACASADYTPATSSGGQFPAGLKDALCATRWMRAHVGSRGLDPQRGIVFGFSAGGNFAEMIGYLLAAGYTVPGSGIGNVLPNGTDLTDASCPTAPSVADATMIKGIGPWYAPATLYPCSVVNGNCATVTNLLTYFGISTFGDPSYMPKALDASPSSLPHPVAGVAISLAHGSSDIVVWPSESTNFDASDTNVEPGLGHMFAPTLNNTANCTILGQAPAASLFLSI